MKKLIICAVAACLMGLSVSALAADQDQSEDRFYVSPMLTTRFTIDPNQFNLDENLNGLQLSVGKNFFGYFALELYAFHFNDNQLGNKFDSDSNVDITGYGLGALFFPFRDFIPVYGLVGYGFGTYDFDAVTTPSVSRSASPNVNQQDSTFFDVGAGLMLPITDYGVALRAEYRYRSADVDAPNGGTYDFDNHIFSVGLYIPIGAPATPEPEQKPAPAPVQPIDSDGDGVSDPNDWCPGTPAGVQVDSTGCAVDSDGDGVIDSKDQCPNTPAGTEVNSKGCKATSIDLSASSVVLRGVTFEYDSSQLTAQARDRLSEVVSALKSHPNIKFRIEGYTDSIASEEYNQKLSERRARSVKQYLTSHGIPVSRITAVVGYGEANPIATNATEAGRAQNRRVELDIVGR